MTRDGRDLAIKVRYPGVRDSIDSDVDNVATLMRLPELLPRGMDIGPLLAEAKHQLHAEAHYLAEAQHLARFASWLTRSDSFALPTLHEDLCTPQVIAMRFMDSAPMDSLVDAPEPVRNQVATALIDLVLRELFVFGAMQTDPNLSNYRHNPKINRIVLMDFGAVQLVIPDLAPTSVPLQGWRWRVGKRQRTTPCCASAISAAARPRIIRT